jgi:pyruvate/2-oxoglutarate dehydrogenase complex dihydrolipoamide dehydrogenase (E3) component
VLGSTSRDEDCTQAFIKIIVDAETRKILGAAILGASGDEAIHGILDIMNAGVHYAALECAAPIHPTVSELIPTMLGELRPIEEREEQDGKRY